MGCNYFKWCFEDVSDKCDANIVRQRKKIINIEKALKVFRKVSPIIGMIGYFYWCD